MSFIHKNPATIICSDIGSIVSMIIHIVLFKFKEDASKEDVDQVVEDFNSLVTKCKTPGGENYIQSFKSGTNISIENFRKGFTHGFVVTFDKKEDRDYYVQQDPAHLAFVKNLGPLDDAIVFDFEA